MTEYFALQFKMLHRQITAIGFTPFLVYPIICVLFVAFSLYLFEKVSYAAPMYALLALSFTSALSAKDRNDFLRQCFPEKNYKIVRITENLSVLLPFVIFLLYKNALPYAAGLVVLGCLNALLGFGKLFHFTMKTPFSHRPFEFSVGYRNSFYIIFLAYLLSFVGAYADNFRLSILSLMLIFFTVMSYYFYAEEEFYVWTYSLGVSAFLREKILTAFFFTVGTIAPTGIVYWLFHGDYLMPFLVSLTIGYGFLTAVILAKYACFPQKIQLPHGIFIIACFPFPPLLTAAIIFFLLKARRRLKIFLHD